MMRHFLTAVVLLAAPHLAVAEPVRAKLEVAVGSPVDVEWVKRLLTEVSPDNPYPGDPAALSAISLLRITQPDFSAEYPASTAFDLDVSVTDRETGATTAFELPGWPLGLVHSPGDGPYGSPGWDWLTVTASQFRGDAPPLVTVGPDGMPPVLPEPGTLMLAAGGLAGLFGVRRRTALVGYLTSPIKMVRGQFAG